jgi:hypothetical protein
MNQNNKTLEDLLSVFSIKHIDNETDLLKVIDYNKVTLNNGPTINNTRPAIIIIDNQNFNENYLLDIFNVCFDNFKDNQNFKNIDLFYLNSIELKSKLLKINIEGIDDKNYAEKEYLRPSFFFIIKSKIEGDYCKMVMENKLHIIDVFITDTLLKLFFDEINI